MNPAWCNAVPAATRLVSKVCGAPRQFLGATRLCIRRRCRACTACPFSFPWVPSPAARPTAPARARRRDHRSRRAGAGAATDRAPARLPRSRPAPSAACSPRRPGQRPGAEHHLRASTDSCSSRRLTSLSFSSTSAVITGPVYQGNLPGCRAPTDLDHRHPPVTSTAGPLRRAPRTPSSSRRPRASRCTARRPRERRDPGRARSARACRCTTRRARDKENTHQGARQLLLLTFGDKRVYVSVDTDCLEIKS